MSRAGGEYTWQDVVEGVTSGNMQLWPAKDAAAVTQLWDFPNRRVLHVLAAGGSLETLKDMQASAAAFAKANGASALTVEGRRGWIRALGWREISTRAELEI